MTKLAKKQAASFKWEHSSGHRYDLNPEVTGPLTVFSWSHYDTDYYVFGPKELVDELGSKWEEALQAYRDFEDSEESQEDDAEWPDEPELPELARQINARVQAGS